MNPFPTLILLLTSLLGSTSCFADLLGREDDLYFGIQISMPLNSRNSGFKSDETRYNLMLIDQNKGMKDGMVLTFEHSGAHSWGYIMPSSDFDPASRDFESHINPIISFKNSRESREALHLDGYDLVWMGAMGLITMGKIIERTLDDVKPDTSGEELQ